MLRFSASKFLMPKEGAREDECEDAVALNVGAMRFALADGATEAFDSGRWARVLAEGWADAGRGILTAEEFGAWVAREGECLQEGWAGRELAWYAEEKARAGSFAAFVGLGFVCDGGTMRWRAIALGDSCLFQLRGESLVEAFPLNSYEAFGSYPALVASRGAVLESALASVSTAAGEAREGDRFLLLSDAAAAWFLRLQAERSPRIEEFASLLDAPDEQALAELFRRERQAGALKDDDVAVINVRF